MNEKILLNSKTLNELFRAWRKLPYSQILNADLRGERFSFEFVVDQSKQANEMLKTLTKLTVEKHPSGTLSFVSYFSSPEIPISTLYRKYRVDFLDPASKEAVDEEKLNLYVKELINTIKNRT